MIRIPITAKAKLMMIFLFGGSFKTKIAKVEEITGFTAVTGVTI